MLKNLPPSSLYVLLKFYNLIWTFGAYRKDWRRTLVIPLLKARKDRSDPSSYRPIALSNCLGKLMEKMVNTRLMWFLEHKKLLSKGQAGFRRGVDRRPHCLSAKHYNKNIICLPASSGGFYWFPKGLRSGLAHWFVYQTPLHGYHWVDIPSISGTFSQKSFIQVKLDGLLLDSKNRANAFSINLIEFCLLSYAVNTYERVVSLTSRQHYCSSSKIYCGK